jgi:hypothetical protein
VYYVECEKIVTWVVEIHTNSLDKAGVGRRTAAPLSSPNRLQCPFVVAMNPSMTREISIRMFDKAADEVRRLIWASLPSCSLVAQLTKKWFDSKNTLLNSQQTEKVLNESIKVPEQGRNTVLSFHTRMNSREGNLHECLYG